MTLCVRDSTEGERRSADVGTETDRECECVKDSTEGERRTADVQTETDGGCECEANVRRM